LPFILTIGLISFISYTTITHLLLPSGAYFAGIIHISLLIMVIWSLLATKLNDPGYVRSQFYSRETQVDIEKL